MKTLWFRNWLPLFFVTCACVNLQAHEIEMVKIPAGKFKSFWIEPKRVPLPKGLPKDLAEQGPETKSEKAKSEKAKSEKAKSEKAKSDSQVDSTKDNKLVREPEVLEAKVFDVAEFSAMATPVTNRMYIQFLQKNPSWRKSRISKLQAETGYLEHFDNDLHLKKGVLSEAPVNQVSWFAARAFCEANGMRLPSTIEWEYMAAASETKADASLDSAFLDRILEWYEKPREGELQKVRSTFKNYYGLYDLHGLVWEWVDDFNSNLVTGESRADTSLNRDLFCGGGSMLGGNKENYAAFMRFAFRSSLKGKSSVWNLGFRCVK